MVRCQARQPVSQAVASADPPGKKEKKEKKKEKKEREEEQMKTEKLKKKLGVDVPGIKRPCEKHSQTDHRLCGRVCVISYRHR